eukprot:10261785-Alexandrium_andersonii.AAC.1
MPPDVQHPIKPLLCSDIAGEGPKGAKIVVTMQRAIAMRAWAWLPWPERAKVRRVSSPLWMHGTFTIGSRPPRPA